MSVINKLPRLDQVVRFLKKYKPRMNRVHIRLGDACCILPVFYGVQQNLGFFECPWTFSDYYNWEKSLNPNQPSFIHNTFDELHRRYYDFSPSSELRKHSVKEGVNTWEEESRYSRRLFAIQSQCRDKYVFQLIFDTFIQWQCLNRNPITFTDPQIENDLRLAGF